MKENNHVEDLITELYDMVQDARGLPLGADKCILERDRVLDMLDEITAQLPKEIKESRTIVESRNTVISKARMEAQNILTQAQEKAQELVKEETIYQEAKRISEEMVRTAQAKILELKRVSSSYIDDSLSQTEEAIAKVLGEVRDTRSKFRSMTATGETKPENQE